MPESEQIATGAIEQVTQNDFAIHQLVARAFLRRGLGDHRFTVVENSDSVHSIIKSSDKTHLEDFETTLLLVHQTYDYLSRQLGKGGFTVFDVLGNAVNMIADTLKAQEERVEKTS